MDNDTLLSSSLGEVELEVYPFYTWKPWEKLFAALHWKTSRTSKGRQKKQTESGVAVSN